MRYGKTHAESETINAIIEEQEKYLILLQLPDKVKKLKKRIKKLEKMLNNEKIS